MSYKLLGTEISVEDMFIAIILLIVTSGFVNILLQYFKLNVCQDARLVQSGVLFLLSLIFGSQFTLILSIIELVIGITDYIAVSNSAFAWLDPNLA
jgi:hypothetical protein